VTKKSKKSTTSKFQVGEQYYHINNKEIVTILSTEINHAFSERGSIFVALPNGQTFDAWVDLLRKLTKLERALK
jgi:hypothetical protein